MAHITTPSPFVSAEPTGTEACGYAELIPVAAGVSACRSFIGVTVAAPSKRERFDWLTAYNKFRGYRTNCE